jgi:aminoglycoside phosphotransferase (APT) family kinase protein
MSQEIDHLSEKLIAYLRDQLNDSQIDYASPLVRVRGGFETQIYRFRLDGAHGEFSKPLILRLYPAFYGTGNAVWDHTIQNALSTTDYPVAKSHLLCTDMSVLGGAFFIMDFLPGETMASAPMDRVPELLGKAHAALHRIDPDSLIESIGEGGIDKRWLYLDIRYEGLKDKASNFPWIREAVDWLIENRPPEPEELSVCHGDFHPLNILIQDDVVTGVLDWGGFTIADPALDVANTIVLSTIPFKHVSHTLGLDPSSIDFNKFAELYLDAYQAEVTIDLSNLDYYRARRCINALIQGAEGQPVWQHPLIIKDLLEFTLLNTGIQIRIPG